MIAFSPLKVEKIKLDIQKLKEVVSGFRIMHLSDLHIAGFGHKEKRLVNLVNSERPDAIFITGDLVNSYQRDFSVCIRTLKELRAAHGIFAVFGNAEHTFRPIEIVNDFEKALKETGVRLLNNTNAELRLKGKSLYLIGVDDPFFLFDKFDEAVQGVPEGAPSILLAHSPDILIPRGDAIVINLLDSELKSEHFRGWGWEDRTSFGPESGDVYFENDGIHTVLVQSRQDGVSLDTILMNPYEDIERLFSTRDYEAVNRLLVAKDMHQRYPDLVMISARDIDGHKMFGKWKKVSDPSTLCGFRLDDLPSRKWHFQPLVSPENYFEAEFTARKRTKYHVWALMKAHKGSPFKDSVYMQFDDSVDMNGCERYRIGKLSCSKERMADMDLILTGHTHGGQIRLPVYGPFATMTSMGKRYASGLFKFGESAIYVSRGYGTSVIPFRMFCPAEITVFTFN
jgi:predicted MPP superfamily phosphohydrolase